MKMRLKVLRLLSQNGAMSIDTISRKLKVSRQYIHRLVKELVEENKIKKMGQAPSVYYDIATQSVSSSTETVSYDQEQFLQQHFLIVDALGNKLEGLSAMQYWCENQNLPLSKTIDEFIQTRNKYLSYFNKEHFIDGLNKLRTTAGIGEIGVDELYYLDFYAIERFGKTRLGCLMHYAKQGQNKKLMQQIANEIDNRIQSFIIQHHIDAVLFVPPTIKRNVQIMDFLEDKLKLPLPKIKVKKISNEIVIPQKALAKLFERVANAKSTFIVPPQKKFNRVLILDDAIGSGATINEIALKIKSQNLANHISGIAIAGSYKGFEVISEL